MKKGHVLGVLTILLLAVVVVAGPGSWKYSASDLYGSNCIQEIIDDMSAGTYTNGHVKATNLTASATVTGADVTATDDVTVGDDLVVSGLLTVDETGAFGGTVSSSNDVTAVDDVTAGDDITASGLITADESIAAGTSVIASNGFTVGVTAGKTFAITNALVGFTNIIQYAGGIVTGYNINGVQN